jgi:hypothetical protein
MWDKIQVVGYVMLFLVAVWAFAATYEPFQPSAFGRPINRRIALAIRVTAAGCAVGTLAVLLLDIFLR